MAPLVSTIEIARRPKEVFAFATDPLRFAEWQRDVVSVRLVGDSRFTTTRRISGADRTMTQEITRNDPPRSWAAQGVHGPIRPHATLTIEPSPACEVLSCPLTVSVESAPTVVSLPLSLTVTTEPEPAVVTCSVPWMVTLEVLPAWLWFASPAKRGIFAIARAVWSGSAPRRARARWACFRSVFIGAADLGAPAWGAR